MTNGTVDTGPTLEGPPTPEEHDELCAKYAYVDGRDVFADALSGELPADWKEWLARRAEKQAAYLRRYPNAELALEWGRRERLLHTLLTHLSTPATREPLLAMLQRDRRVARLVADLLDSKDEDPVRAIAKYARANPSQETRLMDVICDAVEEGRARLAEDRHQWCELYFGANGVIANAAAERRRVHRCDRPKPWAAVLAERFGIGGRTIVNELRRHFWTGLDDASRDRCRRVGVDFSPLPGETVP